MRNSLKRIVHSMHPRHGPAHNRDRIAHNRAYLFWQSSVFTNRVFNLRMFAAVSSFAQRVSHNHKKMPLQRLFPWNIKLRKSACLVPNQHVHVPPFCLKLARLCAAQCSVVCRSARLFGGSPELWEANIILSVIFYIFIALEILWVFNLVFHQTCVFNFSLLLL